jgi:hypothetical protein
MAQRKLARATRNSDRQEEEMTSNAIWFREGLFAPVTEEVTAFDLPVTGRTMCRSQFRPYDAHSNRTVTIHLS